MLHGGEIIGKSGQTFSSRMKIDFMSGQGFLLSFLTLSFLYRGSNLLFSLFQVRHTSHNLCYFDHPKERWMVSNSFRTHLLFGSFRLSILWGQTSSLVRSFGRQFNLSILFKGKIVTFRILVAFSPSASMEKKYFCIFTRSRRPTKSCSRSTGSFAFSELFYPEIPAESTYSIQETIYSSLGMPLSRF